MHSCPQWLRRILRSTNTHCINNHFTAHPFPSRHPLSLVRPGLAFLSVGEQLRSARLASVRSVESRQARQGEQIMQASPNDDTLSVALSPWPESAYPATLFGRGVRGTTPPVQQSASRTHAHTRIIYHAVLTGTGAAGVHTKLCCAPSPGTQLR